MSVQAVLRLVCSPRLHRSLGIESMLMEFLLIAAIRPTPQILLFSNINGDKGLVRAIGGIFCIILRLVVEVGDRGNCFILSCHLHENKKLGLQQDLQIRTQ